MLRGIDRGLMWISWIAAAIVALMLLFGPAVVAEDKAKPAAPAATGSAAPDGKALFVSNCGSCHTLAAAGTKGQVGPKLDGLQLDALTVNSFMKAGPGSMPSFSDMPAAQRDAIVKFVVASSR